MMDEAEAIRTAVSSSYDNVSVLSIYWKSDDSGGAEDSSLFIQTVSKLPNVQTYQRSLSDDDNLFELGPDINRAASQTKSRKLFIFHYAGHAIAGSTPDSLIITPKIDQELGSGPEINMSRIKDELKDMSSKSLALDVLLVVDSCCTVSPGRGRKAAHARVELMATTARKGIKERTLTQRWCEAFTQLLEIGKPFTCDDIVKEITPDSEPAPTFVLREGWDLPITFRLHPDPTASGTLLLVRMPVLLQQLLKLPHVVLTHTDS